MISVVVSQLLGQLEQVGGIADRVDKRMDQLVVE